VISCDCNYTVWIGSDTFIIPFYISDLSNFFILHI